jgi:type II restriction/modification system DNA methylase subunit YeeA
LEIDEQGQPVEPVWPAADVIVGNPPFLGGKRLRKELGDAYIQSLFTLYSGRVSRDADLVTYWFEHAREHVHIRASQRAGLLATNSIRGGANRQVLERIKQTGNIFMAWSDREWVLDGAAVNVSMVGFDDGTETDRVLDNRPVAYINADLTSALDLTLARRLSENLRIAFQGRVVVGPFDISGEVADCLLKKNNPDGRLNDDVIFHVSNAADITGKSRGWYIIDFGQRSLEEAAQYEAPFEYVRQYVKPLRDQNRDRQRREYWWRLGRSGGELRASLVGKSRQIATPGVSKYRIFEWLGSSTVVTNAVFVIARDDDYFFGVLHSRLHELWALRLGSSLEDRPRYTPTSTFETFPFPWAPGSEYQR